MSLFYSDFLPIEVRLRTQPFPSRKAQRKGFRVFRDSNRNSVIIEIYQERLYEASVRAKATRIALLRNHRFSKEAKACGFSDLDEIWILVVLYDWYRLLSEADQIALEELLSELLTSTKKKVQFAKALSFYDAFLKGRNLHVLDQRARWIILKELKYWMEGV